MSAEAADRMYYFVRFQKSKRPFFYNTLHDMEAVVWVAFFSLLNVDYGDNKIRYNIGNTLFTGLLSDTGGRNAFLACFTPALDHYSILVGEERMELLTTLCELRDSLVRHYKESEANLGTTGIDTTKFHGIHEEFRRIWSRCKTHLSKTDLNLFFEVQLAVTKRKRAEDNGGARKKLKKWSLFPRYSYDSS